MANGEVFFVRHFSSRKRDRKGNSSFLSNSNVVRTEANGLLLPTGYSRIVVQWGIVVRSYVQYTVLVFKILFMVIF